MGLLRSRLLIEGKPACHQMMHHFVPDLPYAAPIIHGMHIVIALAILALALGALYQAASGAGARCASKPAARRRSTCSPKGRSMSC